MRTAAEMANDAEREIAVLTAERDDLKLRLDEAQAVIDETRRVVERWRAIVDAGPGPVVTTVLTEVVRSFDRVDGL